MAATPEQQLAQLQTQMQEMQQAMLQSEQRRTAEAAELQQKLEVASKSYDAATAEIQSLKNQQTADAGRIAELREVALSAAKGTKDKTLVDKELWELIQKDFPDQVKLRMDGEFIYFVYVL